MVWIILATLCMGLTGLFIFLAFLKKGQFEDMEEVKYQMFWEEEK